MTLVLARPSSLVPRSMSTQAVARVPLKETSLGPEGEFMDQKQQQLIREERASCSFP